jgi:hypothetical protein
MLVSVLACAGIFSNVRGIVHDPDHRPVAGAQVTLRAAHADWSQTAATTATGEFEFAAVPAGEYRVTVSRDGFAPVQERVTLASGSAPVLHFQLTLAVARQAVEVSERADAINPAAASTTVIDRGEISCARRRPHQQRRLITNFVPPTWCTIAPALFWRASVAGSSTVFPCPTRTSRAMWAAIRSQDIDSLEVERGGYSRRVRRPYLWRVQRLIPRTGFERNREAEIFTSV